MEIYIGYRVLVMYILYMDVGNDRCMRYIFNWIVYLKDELKVGGLFML